MQKEFAETALRLAEEGKISLSIIDAAVERILKYKALYSCGEMANSFEEIKDDLEKTDRMEYAQQVADDSITLLKDEKCLLPLKKEEKTLIVFPQIKVVTLVENDDNTLSCLADYMPFKVDKHYISISPDEIESSELLAKIKDYDKIVYCSYNANFNPTQANLINQIDKDNADYYKNDVRGFESVYDFNGAAEEGFYIRKHVAMNRLSIMGTAPEKETRKMREFSPYDQNWVVYRVTDVMLMKAEALVQKALLQTQANNNLLDELASVSTVEDSLKLADQLYQVNQKVAKLNVNAARQVQMVNARAILSTSEVKSLVDSTKYAVSSVAYDSVDATGYITRQISSFASFTATASELEALVMNERARELCFEGKRWFDMLRYNYRHVEGVNYDVILAHQAAYANNYEEMLELIARKYSGGGKGVTAKMPTEPYLYMPISKSETEVNNALEQNPVYTDGGTVEKN